MTDIVSSNRTFTGLAGSVQKRKTLILHENDPRALDPFYIANYVGEVKVLSDTEYLKYLKTQHVVDSGTIDKGTLVPTIHPPTNVYWDPTNPTDTIYDQSNAASLITINITFDPATDDVATDGTIQYEAVADISNHQVTSAIDAAGGTTSTNAAGTSTVKSTAVKAGVVLSTISSPIHIGSHIQLKWKSVAGVTGYEVGVTGANQNNSSGKNFKIYNENKLKTKVVNGYYVFDIYPKSGSLFRGHYSFTIAAQYNTLTTKAVTYSGFTI
jgi:hypothetical protein